MNFRKKFNTTLAEAFGLRGRSSSSSFVCFFFVNKRFEISNPGLIRDIESIVKPDDCISNIKT